MALTRADRASGWTRDGHGLRRSLTSRFLDQSLHVTLVVDAGGISILKEHLTRVRPGFLAARAFQRTSYLPDEIGQLD